MKTTAQCHVYFYNPKTTTVVCTAVTSHNNTSCNYNRGGALYKRSWTLKSLIFGVFTKQFPLSMVLLFGDITAFRMKSNHAKFKKNVQNYVSYNRLILSYFLLLFFQSYI